MDRVVRVAALLACLLFAVPGARADKKGERQAQLNRFEKLVDTYQGRLEEIVKQTGTAHAELAKWCAKAGLPADAAAEAARAAELDPALASALADLAPAGGAAPAPDEKTLAERTKRRKSLAADLAKRYIDLANWCRKSGMELEFRKTLRKLVRLVPENPDVRKFLGQQKHQGEWLEFEEIQKRKGLRFYKGKWLPEAQYAKTREGDLEKRRASFTKQYKLEFKALYTPHLDVFYTVSDERANEDVPVLTAFFEKVHPEIFTGEFRQPFTFLYVNGPEQFKQIGQSPGSLGVYSNGTLYSYEGAEGTGTYVHELTHGMVDISFKQGVPGWFNEGIASFFESFRTHKTKDGGLEFEFGYVNHRIEVLMRARKDGSMQHLRDFVKRTDSQTSDLDYAHGRALFCYLFSRGLLDAFLLRLQLEPGKKSILDHLEETLLQPVDAIHDDFVRFSEANQRVWTLIKPVALADDTVDAKVRFEEYASWAG